MLSGDHLGGSCLDVMLHFGIFGYHLSVVELSWGCHRAVIGLLLGCGWWL